MRLFSSHVVDKLLSNTLLGSPHVHMHTHTSTHAYMHTHSHSHTSHTPARLGRRANDVVLRRKGILMVSPMVNRKLKAIAKQVVMQCTSFENVLSPYLSLPPLSLPPLSPFLPSHFLSLSLREREPVNRIRASMT